MRRSEDRWYGNIEQIEHDTYPCKEYIKLQESICRNEGKLKATMTDKQKELFTLASHQRNNRKLDRRRRSLIEHNV